MHGHFWSRDEDGGHTIRSAIAENPMLHANITAICLMELDRGLKFYIAVIRILDLCRSCDLNLDPMTFIYERDPYSLKIYRMCEYDFLREGFPKLSSDIHTDRNARNYMPRLFAGGQ